MNQPTASHGGLDPFQAEVARVALSTTEAWSFALAGGNALIAHGLLVRRTMDVDLFTVTPGAPGEAAAAVTAALTATGFVVTADVSADAEFARLSVARDVREVTVDLARDWRAHPPVRMSIGLVLHQDDAVSSKVSAMVGRGLPRDFIDVAAALRHYDRLTLLKLLFERDPGLGPQDVAMAVRQLDLLRDDDFTPYELDATAVTDLRRSFAGWPREPLEDAEARSAHTAAHAGAG